MTMNYITKVNHYNRNQSITVE